MTKQEFPGYAEIRRKRQARANKRERRRADRVEKRKSGLPPFLMIRGGLFDEAICVAAVVVPLANVLYNKHTPFATTGGTLLCLAPLVTVIGKGAFMSQEKNLISRDLDWYAWDQESNLNINKYECKHLAQVMTKCAAKNNPELFNHMIKDPKSVKGRKTASAIIRGHIKSHPEDIQKVLDTFEISTIPYGLYQQLIRRKAR